MVANPCPAMDNPEKELTKVIENYVKENYVKEKYPDWADLDIQVSFKFADKVFNMLREFEGKVDLAILPTYKDFKPIGNVIFPIEVSSGDFLKKVFVKKVFVRAKVSVFKDIVVAAKKIKRGGKIEADLLTLQKRDIAMLPQKYFTEMIEVKNSEAKTTIPKNSTIFAWMVKEIPLVRRGDKVTIVLKGPNLLLKTRGVLLEDGYKGKTVKVRPQIGSSKTKTILDGLLISDNLVEVKL